MGLIIIENEEGPTRELIMVIVASMIFVLLAILILKIYVLPAWGIGLSVKKLGMILLKLKNSNIFKSRSP